MNKYNKVVVVGDGSTSPRLQDTGTCDVFSCDTCGKIFQSRLQLDVHQVTHIQARKHVCAKCGAGFKTSGRLKRHFLKHSNVKPHKCSHCDQRFTQKENLQRHENQHHRNPEMNVYLYCKFCPCKFRLPKQLVNHIKKEHPQNLQPTAGRRRPFTAVHKGPITLGVTPTKECSGVVCSRSSTTGGGLQTDGIVVVNACNLSSQANIQLTKHPLQNQGGGLAVTASGRMSHTYVQVNAATNNNNNTTSLSQQMVAAQQPNAELSGTCMDIGSVTTNGKKKYFCMNSSDNHGGDSSMMEGNRDAQDIQDNSLCHNNDTILKYLTQTSPYKVSECPATTTTRLLPIPTSPSSSSSPPPQNVYVQKVQLQSSSPLLGMRITPSPVAIVPDGRCSSSHDQSVEESISGSLCSSGLTATPYRVHKSANNHHMLPLENGFSLSTSKTYSLNFGLLPDAQLPENFMEDSNQSMDNSSDYTLTSSNNTTTTATIMSGPVSCDRLSQSCELENKVIDDKNSSNSVDCDVITIDSDSNISACVTNECDSDVEIVEDGTLSLVNTSKQFIEESSENSQNSRPDSFRSRFLKRKHTTDHVNGSNIQNEISIVMYQAASPVKIARTDQFVGKESENGRNATSKDNGQKMQNDMGIITTREMSAAKDQGENVVVDGVRMQMEGVKKQAKHSEDTQILAGTGTETGAVEDGDKVACLNEPPLITLFPANIQSQLVRNKGVVSVCSSKSSMTPLVEEKHGDTITATTSQNSMSTAAMTNNSVTNSAVSSNVAKGISVTLIDSRMTDFCGKITNVKPLQQSKYSGLVQFPKLAPKIVYSEISPLSSSCSVKYSVSKEDIVAASVVGCAVSEHSPTSCSEMALTNRKNGSLSLSNAICLTKRGKVVTPKSIQVKGTSAVTAVLSKSNEHYAVVNNTTLHNKCVEQANKGKQLHGGNNILVKEVTLNKNGPSLFERITENKKENAALATTTGDGKNTVLVIETGLSPSISSGPFRQNACESQEESGNSAATKSKEEGIKSNAEKLGASDTGSENSDDKNTATGDHVDDIRNQYRTKESRRKLWGLVQPPCANELLRAKRENLTLDDIYEEKITKLLEKIGLNTFQGIPISQFFSSGENIQRTNSTEKRKEASAPCREELMAKIAQRARYQEQVKVKVQVLMELLEKRKNLKRQYTQMESLEEMTELDKGSFGCQGTRDGLMVNRVETSLDSRTCNSNTSNILTKEGCDKGHNGSAEGHKMVTSNGMVISNSREGFPADRKGYLQTLPMNIIPIASKIQPKKEVLLKSSSVCGDRVASNSVKQTVFDGVFKIPTKCDGVFKIPTNCPPSAHHQNSSSGKAVKIILKSKPPVVANQIMHPQEVQVKQPISLPVTISNKFCRPILPSMIKTGNDNTKAFQSVSNSVFMEPLSVVTSETQQPQQQATVRPFRSYEKSGGGGEWNSPVKLKHFTWSTSSTVSPIHPLLMSPRQSVHQKNYLTQIHHSPKSSIKVESSPAVQNTSVFEANLQENVDHQSLNDQGITKLPNQLHKNPAISPTGSSQNSLPDVDFMLMSSGSQGKQQILSPLKLISGVGDLHCHHSPRSPVKDTSPSKDGSLLTLHDINPSELQALMSSPIKSFELENSNLSTASQTELLETLQNFLRDIPSSVSPLPGGGSTSPLKPYTGKGSDSSSSCDQTNSAIILSTLFDTSPNKDLLRMGGKSRFFKHVMPSVSISQPSQHGGDAMDGLSPGESSGKTAPLLVTHSNRCSSVSSDCQLSPTTSLDLNNTMDEELFNEKTGHKEDLDCPYVPKKLVVNAPELYDENTMDRIVS